MSLNPKACVWFMTLLTVITLNICSNHSIKTATDSYGYFMEDPRTLWQLSYLLLGGASAQPDFYIAQ